MESNAESVKTYHWVGCHYLNLEHQAVATLYDLTAFSDRCYSAWITVGAHNMKFATLEEAKAGVEEYIAKRDAEWQQTKEKAETQGFWRWLWEAITNNETTPINL